MYISWLGQSCFKIQSRDVTLVTDPNVKKSGLKIPRLLNVSIISLSRPQDEFGKIKTEGLIIDGPGEYEVKGTFIQGIAVKQNDGKRTITVYWIEIEGISLGFLGPLNTLPSDKQLEKLEGLDILLVPVGGHGVLNAEKASQIISQIEPRIVIPMYYGIPNLKEKLDPVNHFCKEMGIKSSEKTDKLRIQKKNLPQEKMKIIVLQSQ